ncbi:Crp/Fnr family transcriptional regulator [Caulobacter segnis]|uniref:Crp/Fnr family transcriptional regulator n=1 Tax=Caulobacter segnis TaxID=88688 RepID=UPI00241013EE|nr:Crp/Fnr family transcriptional regulator [Caulobacter segnis]MDG2523509.1 Crp/Fnr family transcriptional regulator [Caulobacter segnis]
MEEANLFLKALKPADSERMARILRRVSFRQDEVLAVEYQPIERVVLPIDCILSVLAVMRDGRQVETRTIGCESGYGLLHALGSPVSFERLLVQVPGDAWVASLSDLKAAAVASPDLMERIVRYAQATLIQAAQSTACNALHSVEQRMSRWLLMTQSRLSTPVAPLTQEHLSIMLGVQRTTVTATASALKARGLIAYSRGNIRILDEAGLKRVACECFSTIDAAMEMMREE